MKVGIVGLGISGLRAAMLLERVGVETVLFEAKGRPGGRLHASDEGDGVLYEAGGEWIDADHERCLGLLREFNLDPDVRGQWPRKLVFKGKAVPEDLVWSEALEDDLRVEAAAKELTQDLKLPAWLNDHSQELDQRRFGDFVREHTSSERGLWWVSAKYRSDEGDDLDRIGLLGWLCSYLNYLNREGDEMSAYRIPGGSRQLCERIVALLKAEPHYLQVLKRVRQSGEQVVLEFDGKPSCTVDKVILTLPPPCLERIVFEPALSVAKRCALEGCEMSRTIKIAWQFERAWWKDMDWGGSMLCDGPIQQTWDGSLGESPVLTAYVCGDAAAKWSELGDPVSAGMYELCQMFPQAREHYIRGWFHNWIRDPYSQGGFSHTAPGYVLEHMAHIAPPEKRIYFAGEHTATWSGFIEGALESAERVVREVLVG